MKLWELECHLWRVEVNMKSWLWSVTSACISMLYCSSHWTRCVKIISLTRNLNKSQRNFNSFSLVIYSSSVLEHFKLKSVFPLTVIPLSLSLCGAFQNEIWFSLCHSLVVYFSFLIYFRLKSAFPLNVIPLSFTLFLEHFVSPLAVISLAIFLFWNISDWSFFSTYCDSLVILSFLEHFRLSPH